MREGKAIATELLPAFATQGDILPSPVVTADPELDITDAILAGLNAEYVQNKNSNK